ncbi:MAG: hypothetical protein JNG85_03365 [Spirochaetaceae bacterium]|nr:hypothetical protein [Spirochaetaceae bacterium]
MTPTDRLKAGISAAYKSKAPATATSPAVEAKIAEGLELSDVLYKPLAWFRYHEENRYFREVKTEANYEDLRALIDKTKAIEPLLVMADGPLAPFGTILRGESRHIVAGRLGIERLPCRLVMSPLTLEEQQAIIWGDNIGRFAVPEDVRTWMMARMFPGYFRGDTVSPSQPTRAEIAAKMGVSDRQVKREAAIMRKASALAESEGREATVEDVKAAREAKNAARREKAKVDENHDPAAPGSRHQATTGSVTGEGSKPWTTGAAPEAPAIVLVRLTLEIIRKQAAEARPTGESFAAGMEAAAAMIEEALR